MDLWVITSQYYCLGLINQLERQGSRVLSPDNLADIYSLLGTIVNSIYTASGMVEAYEHLAGWIGRAFDIPKVRIYLVNPERSELILADQAGFGKDIARRFCLKDNQQAETKAYSSKHYLVSETGCWQRRIPRLIR